MLLAIDVGNTNTVLGILDGEDVAEHWRIATDPDRTADELAVVMQGLLEQSRLGREPDISGIALCSTVPSVLHEMREMCRRYYGDVPAVIVEPGIKTGVPVRMDNPKEVGSDRIMNAAAAVHLYGGPAIVVDFGTSTNFDAVSERGEFVGGALAPGIEISVDALSRRAAQLLKVELARPARVIGKNTVEALQSGHHLRLRRPGRGHRHPDGGRARARRPGLGHDHRHRRAGPAGHRRGRRHRRLRAVAYTDRPAAHLRAQRALARAASAVIAVPRPVASGR